MPHFLRRENIRLLGLLLIVFAATVGSIAAADSGSDATAPSWMTDYAAAKAASREDGKMLLLFFDGGSDHALSVSLDEILSTDEPAREMLSKYVLARLPLDAKVSSEEGASRLLSNRSFREMLDTPGLAIIDFENKDAPHYGTVVSTFPFLKGKPYAAEQVRTILSLPSGTLTQRTLIYAVRVHPEHPKSSNGDIHEHLESEATASAAHQARIRLQGHHNWERRFHAINGHLPSQLWATEVCAESWPGQHLLESAIECVRCWRYSEGHWSAVKAPHPVYGYDMRRGSNGVWYATGIFGKYRSQAAAKAYAEANETM